MSIVQNDRPAGWRWWLLWTPWTRFLLFMARFVWPYQCSDFVFEHTRWFTLWCAQDSPHAGLRARAQREVDGDR